MIPIILEELDPDISKHPEIEKSLAVKIMDAIAISLLMGSLYFIDTKSNQTINPDDYKTIGYKKIEFNLKPDYNIEDFYNAYGKIIPDSLIEEFKDSAYEWKKSSKKGKNNYEFKVPFSRMGSKVPRDLGEIIWE